MNKRVNKRLNKQRQRRERERDAGARCGDTLPGHLHFRHHFPLAVLASLVSSRLGDIGFGLGPGLCGVMWCGVLGCVASYFIYLSLHLFIYVIYYRGE